MNPEGKVVTRFGNVEVGLTKDSLEVGKWTLVTVHFYDPVKNAIQYTLSTIYFDSVLQTSDTVIKQADPAWDKAAFTNSEKTAFMGGFIGEIAGLRVFSPGTDRVNYRNKFSFRFAYNMIASSIDSCMIDLGYDSPVCLTKVCMDGTTTCFDPVTTPPENPGGSNEDPGDPQILIEEDDGISGK